MRVLGAVLAGGKSSRFGSDKAEALLGGRRLIDHTLDALRASADEIVFCGRMEPGYAALDDRPAPALGPLGGLNAALHYAAALRFNAVLAVPIDVHPLPRNLTELLRGGNASYLGDQYAVGFWPVALAHKLDAHIDAGGRSLRSWIAASGASSVSCDALDLLNINRADDLDRVNLHACPADSPRFPRGGKLRAIGSRRIS